MDTLLESLPDRPLTNEEAVAICNHEVVDWGAAPTTDADGRVYVFLLILDETAYGIGYHEEQSKWGVIHSVDREMTGAVSSLDDQITEWATKVYGSQADDIAPDLPDVSQYK